MASVERLLWELTTKIAPTPARLERAKASHKRLRELLWDGNFRNRISGTYLTGSYSRDTAIDPLDDVDIVFVIDPIQWPRSFLAKVFDAKPDPAGLLGSFGTAIRRRYQSSSVRTQRRSVRLQLAHLNLDVVPAIADSTPNIIWIPDRDTGEWIKSGPNVHRIDGEEVNQKNDGRYKPLVKILKYWNSNLPKTARLKSFTVETISARLFRRHRVVSLEAGMAKFMDFVVWLEGQKARDQWADRCGISFAWGKMMVPDTADTGSNVAASVNEERRNRFVELARISRDRLLEAFDAPTLAGAAIKLRSALRIP